MAEIDLTQAEGDALLAMEKIASDDAEYDLPDFGGSLELNFMSNNRHEEFVLNYTRYSINLSKRNHHFRARRIIGLARLDLDGPPHRNPDGKEIGPRHLHLYREGPRLQYAFEVPDEHFPNLEDAFKTLEDFMRYCNIIKFPSIRKGLFS